MIKTLKISKEAHKMLCEYGNKGETFDRIIKRLIMGTRKKIKLNSTKKMVHL